MKTFTIALSSTLITSTFAVLQPLSSSTNIVGTQWKWSTCNATTAQKCGASQPCCRDDACGSTPYFCSVCQPLVSYNSMSCFNRYKCTSYTDDFDPSKTRILPSAEYDGDPEVAEWISMFVNSTAEILDTTTHPEVGGSGKGVLKLSMKVKQELNSYGRPEGQGVSLLSTRWMKYGTITARVKASPGRGIVTALLLRGSDGGKDGVEDEIDFEWVGAGKDGAWTNYFWFGDLSYQQGRMVHPADPISVHGNLQSMTDDEIVKLNATNVTFNDPVVKNYDALQFHDYKIVWLPDRISWYIDNVPVRHIYKNQSGVDSNGNFKFPQREARVALSLWDGGQGSDATSWWAMGPTDWSNPNQEYVAYVDWITMECGDYTSNGLGSEVFSNKTSRMRGMTWNGVGSAVSPDGSRYVNDGKLDIQPETTVTVLLNVGRQITPSIILFLMFILLL